MGVFTGVVAYWKKLCQCMVIQSSVDPTIGDKLKKDVFMLCWLCFPSEKEWRVFLFLSLSSHFLACTVNSAVWMISSVGVW